MTFVLRPSDARLQERVRDTGIRKLLAPRKLFLESRKGNRQQARDYCRKDETRVGDILELGEWPHATQGRRSDLEAVVEDIKAGHTQLQVLEDHPSVNLRYPGGVQRAFALYNRPRQVLDRHVIVLWGTAGTGKTLAFHTAFPDPDTIWRHTEGKGFFLGYEGQENALFDDYTGGQLAYPRILELTDIYALITNVKGSHAPWNARTLVFTSNTPPVQWYGNISGTADGAVRDESRYPAFARRISAVYKYSINCMRQTVITDQTDAFHADAGTTRKYDRAECLARFDPWALLAAGPLAPARAPAPVVDEAETSAAAAARFL